MRFFTYVFCFAFAWSAAAAPRTGGVFVTDVDSLRKDLGLNDRYAYPWTRSSIRVAVLDNGFAGLDTKDPAKHGELPKGTLLIPSYKDRDTLPLDSKEEHGARTARVIWAVTGENPDVRMRLYNARGQTNFLLAMEQAWAWRADIIYCGFTVPTLGDFAGGGRLNAAVDAYVKAGGIFVVPAGNYGGLVHDAPIVLKNYQKDETQEPYHWIEFTLPNGTKSPYLRFLNGFDENEVTITASWTHPTAPGNEGTELDFDLYLYQDVDGVVEQVASSTKRQVVRRTENDGSESLLPMEQLTVSLKAQAYFIGVRWRGGKFGAQDRIRISLSASRPDGIDPFSRKKRKTLDFLDASLTGEIMTLADGAGITVGDFSDRSSRGPTRDGRSKPDILLHQGTLGFSDMSSFAGTTIASALFAGIAASLKAREPRLTQAQLLKFRTRRPEAWLKEQGWEPLTALPELTSGLQEALRATYGGEDFYSQKGPGYYRILVPGRLSELPQYSDLPKYKRPKDPDDYRFFLVTSGPYKGSYELELEPHKISSGLIMPSYLSIRSRRERIPSFVEVVEIPGLSAHAANASDPGVPERFWRTPSLSKFEKVVKEGE